MEYINNKLAIEVRPLIDDGIISIENYKKLAGRNKIEIARRGSRGNPALVYYESLPYRFRNLIDEKVDVYKEVKVNQIDVRITHNFDAMQLFENFRLADGRYLKQDIRREYYANAVVLDAIHKMICDKKAKRRALGRGTKRAWEEIAEGVMELDRTKYPHSLPAHPRRLEERYKQYMVEGPQCLIHKNFMNKNAAKVDDEVKESFIMELLADPRNLDNEQVRNLYNQVADKMDWKKISVASVGIWRDKLDTMIFAGRRGHVAFSNEKTMQVKRSAPTQPLYFWTMDGWDVELLYQQTSTDKNGRTTTTFHHRPTVVVILDACIKYPIGFAVGTHENPMLIREALRNAAQHTAELFGQMYRAHQVQSDRYAIKKMTPYYNVIADKVTPARAHNAKAKAIEPWFGQINKEECQLMPNWAGFGITAKKDNQPNREYLNNFKNNFPDYAGVVKQVEMIIARRRAMLAEKFLEKWNALPDSDKLPMQYDNYLLYFGEISDYRYLLRGSGISATLGGVKHEYDCFDVSFRDHSSVRWELMYDPRDPSRALAVSEEQSLRYMLEEKYVQPMALKDRKPGDSDQLQRVKQYNAELTEKVINTRAKAADLVRETLESNPALEETTLRKLLISDSRGQHKDRLGDTRMKALNKVNPPADDDDDDRYFDRY